MKNVQIKIANPLECDWRAYKKNRIEIWVRSRCHLAETFLDSRALVDKIADLVGSWACDDDLLQDRLSELTNSLNGSYAIVLRTSGVVFVSVDHMRSIPLFYSHEGGRLFISDSAETIRRSVGDPPIDRHAALEFLLAGYVTGDRTLFGQVKQVEPGCGLWFHSDDTAPMKICSHPLAMVSSGSPPVNADPYESFHAVLRDSFIRLLKSTGGARYIVPLSDGYDSRLILHMLHELGKKEVLCISYGRPRSAVIRSARQTAQLYGYPWRFIRYSRQLWRRSLSSRAFKDFEPLAHNCCSLPHIQDFPAFLQLKENKILRPNDVILPGHTATMYLKGTAAVVSSETAAEAILRKHFNLWDWSLKRRTILPALKRRIVGQVLASGPIESHGEALRAVECWELRERQAKFIVNSVRTYDYFGYQWRLPLWDKATVRYWGQLPLEIRQGKEPIRWLLDGKTAPVSTRTTATNSHKHFIKLKMKLRNWPVCHYLVNKLDFRKNAVLSYWKHPILFYGMTGPLAFWSAYHNHLVAYSFYLRQFYWDTYKDSSLLELTRFFTRAPSI